MKTLFRPVGLRELELIADSNWIGDSSGADIQVKAGKYDIWFDDIDNRYTLIAIP